MASVVASTAGTSRSASRSYQEPATRYLKAVPPLLLHDVPYLLGPVVAPVGLVADAADPLADVAEVADPIALLNGHGTVVLFGLRAVL